MSNKLKTQIMKKTFLSLIFVLCTFSLLVAQNGVYFYSSFKKQSCKDSIGTLTVIPYNGLKPYRVTVGGQAADVQDSLGSFIFKNIKEKDVIIRVEDNAGVSSEKSVLMRDSTSTSITRFQYFSKPCETVGQLLLYSYGGKPPYKYELDGVVQRDSNILNVKTGSHSLIVTDLNGCRETINFTLQPKGLLLNVALIPTTCNDTVPQININVTGGQAPYQYYANGFSKASNFFKLNTGTYNIVVKDVNGCSDSSWQYVRQKKDSLIVKTSFIKTNCTDTIGTLMVLSVNSNTSQFVDYQLDNRGYTKDLSFSNVSNGYHIFKARTTEGCILESPINIFTEILSIIPNIKSCFKSDSTFLYAPVSSGFPSYTLKWSDGSNGYRVQVTKPGVYFLTVTNSQGCSAITKYEIESCVWSGDTDTSGLVDNRDFLNIGLAYGENGFKRDTINTFWFGQFSNAWSKQTPALTNYKHIDTNGDGIINASDTMAILQNWSRKHNLVSTNGNGTSPRGVAPPIYVKIDKITEGVNVLPIIFGESASQALGVYGLAYSIDFDENIIEESSVYVIFSGSWFGNNDKIAMYKVQDGKVHIALTKTNKININGAGQIAQLYFKVKAGKLNQNVVFKTENQIAINNNAQELPIQTQTTNASVTTSINDTYLAQSVQIYPNPVSDNLTIETQDLKIKEVAILDLTGRIIQSYKTDNNRLEIPLNQQVAGSYFVKIMTDKGTVVKRFVKI
jgi:Secretion system C-terminal sorting domain